MNTFTLKIIACDNVFYDGECVSLTFPGFDGQIGILANHIDMTTTVEVGEIHFKLPDGTSHTAIVSDGLLTVEKNCVTILVYSAEHPEDIDAFRAEAALERAKEQLQRKQSIMEYHISTASMARAIARLRGVGKYEIK